MATRTSRLILSALGVSALYVGVWAEFVPASFYRSFPGLGRHWVSPLGPYDEHLVRDVGGLYLALAVASAGAWWLADHRTTVVVALAWFAFSLPHLVFHLAHLEHFGALDQALNIVLLALTAVGAGALALGNIGSVGSITGAGAPRSHRDLSCG